MVTESNATGNSSMCTPEPLGTVPYFEAWDRSRFRPACACRSDRSTERQSGTVFGVSDRSVANWALVGVEVRTAKSRAPDIKNTLPRDKNASLATIRTSPFFVLLAESYHSLGKEIEA